MKFSVKGVLPPMVGPQTMCQTVISWGKSWGVLPPHEWALKTEMMWGLSPVGVLMVPFGRFFKFFNFFKFLKKIFFQIFEKKICKNVGKSIPNMSG